MSNEQNTEKKGLGKFRIFLIVLVSGIIIGTGVAVTFLFIRTKDSKPSGVMKSDVASETSENENGEKTSTGANNTDMNEYIGKMGDTEVTRADVSNLVDNVMPSVVSIKCTSVKARGRDSWDDFFYYDYGYLDSELSGTGFIIGQNGSELLIATNNSVVENSDKFTVTLHDGTKHEATVKGSDSYYDLAVIAVDMNDLSSDTLNSIKIATIGSSDQLSVGSVAIAIGNSLGYGQSVTVGYIGAIDRSITINGREMMLLQTDAAINEGNNGGPLINIRGEVIGIASEKYTSYSSGKVEGMCYAIPISKVIPVINELMNRVELETDEIGYLGIVGKDVSDSYSKTFSMPKGVYVYSTDPGSPADNAGIRAGDIITEINGREVVNMEQLKEILSYIRYGTEIEIKVSTKGVSASGYQERTITVELGKRSDYERDN